jgi:transcriptional regulator with XRE-family HTH domain
MVAAGPFGFGPATLHHKRVLRQPTVVRERDTGAGLGARVRALRRERGLTLKALGRRAGLSHPFLSQVERGLARPSVGSMERIAAALDVGAATLLTPPPQAVRLVRAGEGSVAAHADSGAPGGIRRLSDNGAPLEVREWSGGARSWASEPDTAPGPVVLYVVRGTLELELDGTVHALGEGDTLLFDGTLPHRLRRTGGVATRALYVAGA